MRQKFQLEMIIGAAFLTGLLFLLAIWLFHFHSTKARITSTSWTHTETLETLVTYTNHGWRHNAEWGARDFTGCYRKYYGEDCDYIEVGDVPVPFCTSEYKTWCDGWQFDRWQPVATTETGGRDFKLWWPNLEVGQNQRVVKTGKYFVGFSDEQSEYNFHPETEEEYMKFSEKGIWKVEVNRVGMIRPGEQQRPH